MFCQSLNYMSWTTNKCYMRVCAIVSVRVQMGMAIVRRYSENKKMLLDSTTAHSCSMLEMCVYM